MKTVKFAQVLKFSENLVKVDKPEEERYVTVLLYGRGVIEREIKEGKVPVAFTGYKAHAGQLIISTINARNGAAGIIPAELDGAVVSKDFPLFDIDHECVDEQYLLYYLWSDSFIHKAEQNSFGATMPRLHVKPFLNMQMRLPALSEQKRRTHTLCHVESLLNAQSHLLTKLDELVKSRFVEMFGEPIANTHSLPLISLSEVGSWNSGGTPSRSNPAYFEGDIDWYSAGELNTLYLEGSVEKITQDALENSTAKLFPAGSMLVGMYDTAAFKMGILKWSSASNQACACIEPNNSIDIVWLYHVLQIMKPHFLEQRRGIRQKNLNLGMIKSFQIPYASKPEQNRFAAFVTEVDKSKLSYEMEVAA